MNCPKCGCEYTAIGYKHDPDDWKCLVNQLTQRDAEIESLCADINEIWQWAKMVWGDSSDFPDCIQKAGQYYPAKERGGAR